MQRDLLPDLARPTSLTGAEWWTPQPIIDAARASMGGIDLDPASCADAQATVRAARWIGLPDDGLAHDWAGRVWLNPPWSEPGKWTSKLLAERDAGRVTAACCIGPLSASLWVKHLWQVADLVCWIRGDLHTWQWGGPDAAASNIGRPWTWGIMLAMFGADPEPLRPLGACR